MQWFDCSQLPRGRTDKEEKSKAAETYKATWETVGSKHPDMILWVILCRPLLWCSAEGGGSQVTVEVIWWKLGVKEAL